MSLSFNISNGSFFGMNVYCYSQNQLSVNRYFWEVLQIDTGGSRDIQGYMNTMVPDIQARYLNILSEKAYFLGVGIYSITNPRTPEIPIVLEANGSVEGQALPGQVCGILTRYASGRGPSKRGRVYLPFPSEASNTNESVPGEIYVSNVNDLGSLMMGNISVTDGMNPARFQALLAHNGIGALEGKAVIGWVGKQKWGTQKSRGNYGKPNQMWP